MPPLSARVRFCRGEIGHPHLLLAGRRPERGPQNRIERAPPFHLLHLVTRGRGWVALDGRPEMAVGPGDAFLCRPGERIRYRQDPAAPWRYRWLGFAGEGLEGLLARCGFAPGSPLRRGRTDRRIEALHTRILGALTAGGACGELAAQALLLRLFARLLATAPQGDALPSPPTAGSQDAMVEKACQFMINHYAEGIQAAEVARRIGYERSYFSRLFTRITGGTLQSYLARLRLQRAREMLRDPSFGVAEVAASVGLPDPKTFGRFFARHAGLSPLAWRRTAVGGEMMREKPGGTDPRTDQRS